MEECKLADFALGFSVCQLPCCFAGMWGSRSLAIVTESGVKGTLQTFPHLQCCAFPCHVLKYSICLFCFAFPLEIRIFKILGMEEMKFLAIHIVSGLPITQTVRHLLLCKYSHLESFSFLAKLMHLRCFLLFEKWKRENYFFFFKLILKFRAA